MPDPVVFTVGHSTHSIERFISLLQANDITAIADVRSRPYSRFNPQFNREDLKAELTRRDISYVFLGRELGARPEDENCYVHGQAQYDRIAQSAAFKEGIRRIAQGASEHRIALMCAEKEPLECHRTILVTPALQAAGLAVKHIHPDRPLEDHADAELRLLDIVGLPRQDMFRSAIELIREAMHIQEARIAHQGPDASSGARRRMP